MKYLLEYKDHSKYNELTLVEFKELLANNCKNYSPDNNQLYRGDSIEEKYLLHSPIERYGGITYTDFFDLKAKDTEKYPVVRHNSLIGVGGGNKPQMLEFCKIIGSTDGMIDSDAYVVIPFDNSKLVFCPSVDLYILDTVNHIKNVNDEDFVMCEYTENFKVPVSEIEEIQKRLKVSNKHNDKGFEFFTSSPCLLINIKELKSLK